MQPIIELKSELEGIIKLEVIKEDGTLKEAAGLNTPFYNLITDVGLDYVSGTESITSATCYCRVGTSSTPPTVSDTALGSQTGSVSNLGALTNSVQYLTKPYYSKHQVVYTFNVGSVSGNLTEIGFFTSSSDGTMWSRALIKDSNGNPTTLTLLATEQLKVTYTVIRYIPASLTGSFTLNTNGTNSTINYTITPANISNFANVWYEGYCGITAMYIFARETDILGPVSSVPDGSYSGESSYPLPYVNGSFYRDSTTVFPVSSTTFKSGIGSFTFWIGTSGADYNTGYQCSFSPKIMKTSSQTLNIGIRVSWGRTTQQ